MIELVGSLTITKNKRQADSRRMPTQISLPRNTLDASDGRLSEWVVGVLATPQYSSKFESSSLYQRMDVGCSYIFTTYVAPGY